MKYCMYHFLILKIGLVINLISSFLYNILEVYFILKIHLYYEYMKNKGLHIQVYR